MLKNCIAKTKQKVIFLLILTAMLSIVSCKNESKKTVVIWTNKTEFLPYAEVFNTSQNKVKALVLYRENLAESLPAEKDKTPPDIVVGDLLRTERKRKQFRSLNYLFTTGEINESVFYKNILDSCRKGDAIYQIPVSFNLPAIVFSAENSESVHESYILSPDQVRKIGGEYNEKNKNDLYTKMGFAPQWYPGFVSTIAKLNGANFTESGNSFVWDSKSLEQTISQLRNWTEQINTCADDEQNFSFKYLYTPPYKQILSNHCLFAFMPSNELFSLSPEQLDNIDFRWLHKNMKIPIEDSMITLGIYKKAKHKASAEKFISWFFTEEAQKECLKHIHSMHLNTETFGIVGGFSTLKSVNERVLPTYYISLISNIPIGEYLEVPKVLPLRWESMKEKIIEKYLIDAINAEDLTKIRGVEERINDWHKQYF